MIQLKRFIVTIACFGCIHNSYANTLTVTDQSGKVLHTKKLKNRYNQALYQDATEYSIQAIFDELHKAEHLAMRDAYLRQVVQNVKQKETKAKSLGKIYLPTPKEREALIRYAKRFEGGRYIWGGTTPEGFDCSGYVQYLYGKHGIKLPRTALAQSRVGKPIPKSELKKGDLVFFLTDTKRNIPITHVGIYLGNNRFIHAASKKKGIIISPLDKGYYANRFVQATRILHQ